MNLKIIVLDKIKLDSNGKGVGNSASDTLIWCVEGDHDKRMMSVPLSLSDILRRSGGKLRGLRVGQVERGLLSGSIFPLVPSSSSGMTATV
ncbi:hypothetical protein Pcinc_012386 [Petrolisthes cinctipes]|uniref:Uncharacterized protein n=1 Tax=Petrolisthes cinctipes TaxID=88211 RepID=A0AAE1FZL4_PETCI|nr:hypothetical protein Pcinc_012386 [Petrolisthes cinctipes]